MQLTRRQLLGAAGALALAACGEQGVPRPVEEHPTGDGVTAAAGDLVYLDTNAGLAVLDPASGQIRQYTTPAVLDPGGMKLFTSIVTDGVPVLTTVEARTGAMLASAPLPRPLAATVAASSGRRVALTEPGSAHHTPYEPTSRSQTTIVVADPAGRKPPRDIHLNGNIAPEAFASGDDDLFVIEYLPADKPDRYRVRRLSGATGAMGPLLTRDKRPVPAGAEEEMRGQGRMQVLAPDRWTLFTLYTRQDDHLHTRDLLRGARGGARSAEPLAFVHTLSLNQGWAYCLDLPEPFGVGPATAHALAIAPDGQTLFVVDHTSGRLAAADTRSLQLVRGAELPELRLAGWRQAGSATAALAAGPDGALYLSGRDAVMRVDGAALQTTATWPVDALLLGLALSRDGQRLYAATPGQIVILDAASGQPLGRLPVEGLTGIRAIS